MPIFNSLGSNYTMADLSSLITGFNPNAKRQLLGLLEDKYSSSANLTYKGREALYLALANLDLKKGDGVAVNGYTCFAVYDAVVRAGLKPVFIDISKNELNFSSASLKKSLKKGNKVKAVIVQNTLGTPADIEKIEKLCKDKELALIEDLAHSIGMFYADGREAGTVAEQAALSFSQDKVIDAVSGGALITSSDFEYSARKISYFKLLKDYYYIPNTLFIRGGYAFGIGKVQNFLLRKFNFLPRPMDGDADDIRIPDVWHSSLALKRFMELDDSLQHRQEIAEVYRSELPKNVQLKHHDRSIYLRFPILVEERSSLVEHLKSSGIHVSDIWYESPISPSRELENTSYKPGECPNSEFVAERMLNLPTHINISVDDAYFISEKVNLWLSKQK